MLSSKELSILNALSAKARENEIEIVTVEIVGAKKSPIIRIYIDNSDGIDFNALSSSQEWIGQIIEEMDPFPGAYTLEVSSPGIDRPLRTAEHFKRFVGEKARIKMQSPIDGSFNFTGLIDRADDEVVVVELEDKRKYELPINEMKKANLVGKIEF